MTTKSGGTEKPPTDTRRTRDSHLKTDNTQKAIIYGLRASSGSKYHYVGQTTNRPKRLATYQRTTPTHNRLLDAWLDQIGRANLVMDDLAECGAEHKYIVEADFIEELLEDGHPLVNHRSESSGAKQVRQFLAAIRLGPQYFLTPPPLRFLPEGYIHIGRNLRNEHGTALRLTQPALLEELSRALEPYEHLVITRPDSETLNAGMDFADKGGWFFYAKPSTFGVIAL